MKKLIALLIVGIAITGCQKKGGEQYIGKWQSEGLPNLTLQITKHNNGDGYTINEEVFHAATPANKKLDWPASPSSVEKYTYVAIPDGDVLNVTLPNGAVTVMSLDNDEMIFDIGRACDKCSKYKKAN